MAHEREIVADEDDRRALRLLDLQKQVDDGRLHRDVERRDRLVGDQDVGRRREGARDGDALLLAAREARGPHAHQARREAHHLEELGDARLCFLGALVILNFLSARAIGKPALWEGFSVASGFWNTICTAES